MKRIIELLMVVFLVHVAVLAIFAQQDKFTSDNIGENLEYGLAVACSGDGNYMVVGSPKDTVNGLAAGAVYIYLKENDANWVFVDRITAPVGHVDNNDDFGASVDISKDGMRIIVGAPRDDDGGLDAGAVYIFNRIAANNFGYLHKRMAGSPQSGAWYGSDVAIDKDGTYILVGEEGRRYQQGQSEFENAGAAYAYTNEGQTYGFEVMLQADTFVSQARFGCSVDIDSEGEFAIVGASNDRANGMLSRGAAYLFEHDMSPDWTMIQKLVTEHPSAWRFGSDVALADFLTRAVIGAPGDPIAVDSGFAFIYSPDGLGLSLDTFAAGTDRFATTVDVDTSGQSLVAGSPSENSVYLYSLHENNLFVQSSFTGFDINTILNEEFGETCALSRDGQYVLSGAPNHRIGGIRTGAAYADNLNIRCVQFQRLTQGTISTSVYRANGYIEASIPVDSLNDVLFVVGDSLILRPGFDIPANTEMDVINAPCNTGL